jgi:hypothetical protein
MRRRSRGVSALRLLGRYEDVAGATQNAFV